MGLSKHAAFIIESSALAQEKKIAAGGGGELFLAKVMDPRLKKNVGPVVVQKILFSKTATIEQSFYQEVGIMIMLSQFPHFCKIVGFTENPLSIVMKNYPDGSLHSWMHQNNLSKKITSIILRDIAEALKTMHSQYLAHCDIKPQNVLVEMNGNTPSCALTDFGITQILSDSIIAAKSFNVLPIRGLSIAYASPEAFSNFRTKKYSRVDFKRYDIYSYACVILEVMSRRAPWS
jgi:serine/threonine protein kinase